MDKWNFWIDRGGTFTDIIARKGKSEAKAYKFLSDTQDSNQDAVLFGIRKILGIKPSDPIPLDKINEIRLGSTVGTNALLERKGAKTALCITKGFKDLLRIGYQNRPDIFAANIILPELLYSKVVEVEERIDTLGRVLITLNENKSKQSLKNLLT